MCMLAIWIFTVTAGKIEPGIGAAQAHRATVRALRISEQNEVERHIARCRRPAERQRQCKVKHGEERQSGVPGEES